MQGQEVALGKYIFFLGGESLAVMVRWRRAVVEAIRPVAAGLKEPGADAFGEFVRKAAESLTLEAKLALIYAWQPELAQNDAEILETSTDVEVEAAFVALLQHAYPLAQAARVLAPMNGNRPDLERSTPKSYG